MTRAQKALIIVSIGLMITVVLLTGYLLDKPGSDTGVDFVATGTADSLLGPVDTKARGALVLADNKIWLVPVRERKALSAEEVARLATSPLESIDAEIAAIQQPESLRLTPDRRAVTILSQTFDSSGSFMTMSAVPIAGGRTVRLVRTKKRYELGEAALAPAGFQAAAVVRRQMNSGDFFSSIFGGGRQPQADSRLVIFDFASGRARLVNPAGVSGNVVFTDVLAWRNDGLIVLGQRLNNGPQPRLFVYKVDAESGRSRQLADLGVTTDSSLYQPVGARSYSVSPNGDSLWSLKSGTLTLYDLANGGKAVIAAPVSKVTGRKLFFSQNGTTWSKDGTALLMAASESRPLSDVPGSSQYTSTVYSRDVKTDKTSLLIELTETVQRNGFVDALAFIGWSRAESLIFASPIAAQTGVPGTKNALYAISDVDGSRTQPLSTFGSVSFIGWL